VLFSQESVADFINANFEPVWETVRPVPIVRIDFGNGTVLTRTLHGNILTSVCNSDGMVLDALPGIYLEKTYLDRLNQLRLLAAYVQTKPAEKRAEALASYHKTQAEALEKKDTPERFVAKRKVAPIGKAAIERRVELIVLEKPDPTTLVKEDATKPTVSSPEDLKYWDLLAQDTTLNETTRRRQIHELLCDKGLVHPDIVTKPIYKDVLHADLDDPYLGLGKVLFANYPFAEEDKGK
jgi:hypothetical protein